MLRTAFCTLLAAGSVVATPAVAAERWQIDTAHTQVLFTVDHLGFTTLTGQFRVLEGDLFLDPADWARSSVSVRIAADSVDMNHEGINRHLKNPDFFDVEQYPSLEFRSTAIETLGDGRLRMHGELSMIGQTRPVSLDVTVNKLGPHPMRGTPWAGFRAEGSLKRSDWGMSYGVPGVGDEIGILINLEAGGPAE